MAHSSHLLCIRALSRREGRARLFDYHPLLGIILIVVIITTIILIIIVKSRTSENIQTYHYLLLSESFLTSEVFSSRCSTVFDSAYCPRLGKLSESIHCMDSETLKANWVKPSTKSPQWYHDHTGWKPTEKRHHCTGFRFHQCRAWKTPQ